MSAPAGGWIRLGSDGLRILSYQRTVGVVEVRFRQFNAIGVGLAAPSCCRVSGPAVEVVSVTFDGTVPRSQQAVGRLLSMFPLQEARVPDQLLQLNFVPLAKQCKLFRVPLLQRREQRISERAHLGSNFKRL